jgi:hypothetical protein
MDVETVSISRNMERKTDMENRVGVVECKLLSVAGVERVL